MHYRVPTPVTIGMSSPPETERDKSGPYLCGHRDVDVVSPRDRAPPETERDKSGPYPCGRQFATDSLKDGEATKTGARVVKLVVIGVGMVLKEGFTGV